MNNLVKFLLAAFVLSPLVVFSQPYDTLYGEGHLRFLRADTEAPLPGVNIDFQPVIFGELPYDSLYTGLSDSTGAWLFNVPACILNLLSAPGFDSDFGSAQSPVNPNPGSVFHAALPDYRLWRAELRSFAGNVVATGSSASGSIVLNISHLPEGMYLYRLIPEQPRPGERPLTGKFLHLRHAPSGPPSIMIKSNNKYENNAINDSLKKASESCEATYQITYTAPEGFVHGEHNAIVNQGGEENDIDILVQPWDTAYASGSFITRDGGSPINSANFVPATLTVIDMQDVLIPTTIEYPAVLSGSKQYQNLPVAVNTQGDPATTSAQIQLAWPDVVRHTLDSTSVDPGWIGWHAGDTTFTVTPGNNGPQFAYLDRMDPDPRIGSRYVRGLVSELGDGHPEATEIQPAENALVVIGHTGGIDSVYTASDGSWISPQAYPHGETIKLGMGYPGGLSPEGKGFKSYKNIPYTVQGRNYFDLAAGDSTFTVSVAMLPDTIFSRMNNVYVPFSASDFIQGYGVPNYHQARFDTLGYFISDSWFASQEIVEDFIENNFADLASIYTPVTFVRVYEQFENPAYDKNTATALSHGVNIFEGNNNISNQQNIPADLLFQVSGARVSSHINISLSTNALWKELVFRTHGFYTISNWAGVMNVTAQPIVDKDFAAFNSKFYMDKAMFRYEWEGGERQHNIFPTNYISDNNNITPE